MNIGYTGRHASPMPLVILLIVLILPLVAPAQAPPPSIEVPYRGLEYLMATRDGLTVMVAPLDLNILKYSAAHVWITNGTRRTIHAGPQLFTARARVGPNGSPSAFAGVPDFVVVSEVMQRARFGDVLSLVRAYERNLYGFKNPTAMNHYQQRKQIAAAEGTSRKFRAGALVSALVLQNGPIPPGEFREGTVFFPTGEKPATFVEFETRLAGQSFTFQTR